MCWCRATPTICRCIARRRSWRGRASSIDRATLAFWVGYAATEIAPVVARLREILLASARLFADETVVPVLDPGRGRTKQGYAWAIARDDRPWGGSRAAGGGLPLRAGPRAQHAKTLLGGYRGILQCDGYAAYKSFAAAKRRDVGRWRFAGAMCVGSFYDLAKAKAPIARKRCSASPRSTRSRRRSAAKRLIGRWLRQAESKPLVDGPVHLVRGAARETARAGPDCEGDPLCAEPPGWARAVPR